MKLVLDMKTQMICDNMLVGYQQPLCAYVYFQEIQNKLKWKGVFKKHPTSSRNVSQGNQIH
jgi:hypothetical protein